MKDIENQLKSLFTHWSKETTESIALLPQSGSYRKYFRISSKTRSAIGAWNEDQKENRAFIEFSNIFSKQQVRIPKIYASNLEQNIYLLEDLGNTTLFNHIYNLREKKRLSDIDSIYKKVLDNLLKIQLKGKEINFSYAYPRESFDEQSILWDLNYFKYNFLKVVKIPFDEQALENDFKEFSSYLLKTDTSFFLYRDFQSRNIMINDEEIVFIDYQGGRKGALAYDVASLLFESKINLPFKKRVEYLNYYISKLEPSGISAAEFKKYYYPYVLIRLMQAMGAYGFRGIIENKPLFVESIPLAQKSLQWIFNNIEFDIKIPEIFKCLKQIANEPVLTESGSKNNLTVSIKSFSYRRGIPQDNTGNGGGFVFDCRAIHNPGRYDTYRPLTGKDKPVQDFLKKEDEMSSFLKHVFALAENTIDKYIIRGFSNLSINFGCTGGQHRSVYAAEMLHKHLSKKYNLNLDLKHLELTKVNFLQ